LVCDNKRRGEATIDHESGNAGVVWDRENARLGLFRDIAKYITRPVPARRKEQIEKIDVQDCQDRGARRRCCFVLTAWVRSEWLCCPSLVALVDQDTIRQR